MTRHVHTFALRLAGGVFLALGAIGLAVPVWPTTIFWILAALCFTRSAPGLRDWIYARPGVGPTIRLFLETGRLTRRAKLVSLGGITAAGAIAAVTLWGAPMGLIAALALLGIAAAYVASRPGATRAEAAEHAGLTPPA